MRRALKRIGADTADFILVDQPLAANALGPSWPARIIYRPTDVYESGSAGSPSAHCCEISSNCCNFIRRT